MDVDVEPRSFTGRPSHEGKPVQDGLEARREELRRGFRLRVPLRRPCPLGAHPRGGDTVGLDRHDIPAETRSQGSRAVGSHDLPLVDDRDPVAEPVGLVHIVRAQQHRHAASAQRLDVVPDRPADRNIETERGFVEKEDLGLVNETAREVQFLLHAPGIVPRRLVGHRLEADERQKLIDPPRAALPGNMVEVREERKLLPRGEVAVHGDLLRDVADSAAHLRRVLDHIRSGHLRLARVRPRLGHEDAYGRRLAGAVWAQQSEDLPFAHLEIHARQRRDIPETLGEPANADRRHDFVLPFVLPIVDSTTIGDLLGWRSPNE